MVIQCKNIENKIGKKKKKIRRGEKNLERRSEKKIKNTEHH